MGIEILFYIALLLVVLRAAGGKKEGANSKFDKNKKFPKEKKV